MKYLDFYRKRGLKEDEVFNYFIKNIRTSIKTWDYFVNWDKVNGGVNKVKIELNILNSLIGANNLEKEFVSLIQEYPKIIRVFPILLAVREDKLEILKDYQNLNLNYEIFDFNTNKDINGKEAKNYFNFVKKSGLIKLFENKKIKNFVDYVFGVEVGLDSNGRKNRGGILMEGIVEMFIKDFSKKNKGIQYLSQARASRIKEAWGIDVKFDKSSRSYDFAIFNSTTKKLFLIETNFYNGGGSKLKSVCGEFKTLFRDLAKQEIEFIWITDGKGWEPTRKPLEESFDRIDYLFNLKILEEGVLGEVLN
jgi:type II restriction enzyme